MNILILGAAGFIGTNLTIELAKEKNNIITVVDNQRKFFCNIERMHLENVVIKEVELTKINEYSHLLKNQDIVYHLVSTTVPTNSNKHITQEIEKNVIFSSNLLEACVENHVKRVVFMSSGGTVYGKECNCPIKEDVATNPISSYGIQKVTIEKLLYLYNYIYGLDYRIVRLANPYGPYQRPNGILGAVTTFTYKALMGQPLEIYGNGNVVRDFIYIDDAIKAIINISNEDNVKHKVFNVGSGCGTSINQVVKTVCDVLKVKKEVIYSEARKVDVPINYLDISLYEKYFGRLNNISLADGIEKTADFMKKEYKIC